MPVDLTAPEGVRSALRRGLRLHEAGRSGDGLKPETVAWARRLAGGDAASEQKVREMSAWHKRHAASKSPGWDKPGKEKPGFVAFLLWGGEPGDAWADRKVRELDNAEQKSAHTTTFTRAIARKVDPESLIRGEPLVVLRPGIVRDYDGQELDGNVTDVGQLEQMVLYFEKVQRPTGQLPLIDFNHMAVGSMSFFASPEAALPMGAVLDMRIIEDDAGPGLEVVPGWTRRGRKYVDDAEGLLYPSATYRLAPTGDRMNAEPAAQAALLAFAITPMPATRVDQLGAIRSYNPAGGTPALPGGVPVEDPDIEAEVETRAEEGDDEAEEVEMTPEEKAQRIADLEAELRMLKGEPEPEPEEAPGPAAEAFARRLVTDKAINPAERAKWAQAYQRNPAKAMSEAPAASAAYRAPAGEGVKPKATSAVKTQVEAVAAVRSLASAEFSGNYQRAREAYIKRNPTTAHFFGGRA